MDEPYSGALFDFDFERTESISGVNLEVARNEVRARIFEEVLLYRPALAQYSSKQRSGLDAKGGSNMDRDDAMETARDGMEVQDADLEADMKKFHDASCGDTKGFGAK